MQWLNKLKKAVFGRPWYEILPSSERLSPSEREWLDKSFKDSLEFQHYFLEVAKTDDKLMDRVYCGPPLHFIEGVKILSKKGLTYEKT